MDYLHIVLRIIHIGAGIFWVGGVLILFVFIGPTVGAIGEAGPKFIAHLVKNQKFVMRMSAAAGLTALAGAWLYWNDSSGFDTAWMRSSVGIGFSIGAAFGAIGFVFGILIGVATRALVQLGEQIQGKPSPEQLAQLQKIQQRQKLYSRIAAISLTLSVLFMAMARFLVF